MNSSPPPPSPAACDASALLPNAESLGDCSFELANGFSCTNTARPGYHCTASTCGDGAVFTAGSCGALCDASELLPDAVEIGDCSSALSHGASCANLGMLERLCSSSTCLDGVLTPGVCLVFCDASAVLANAVGLGDCSNALASGDSCLNDAVPGGDSCSPSTCQDGVFNQGG